MVQRPLVFRVLGLSSILNLELLVNSYSCYIDNDLMLKEDIESYNNANGIWDRFMELCRVDPPFLSFGWYNISATVLPLFGAIITY